VSDETTNENMKNKLDKITAKMLESQEMNAESLRRQQVAQTKLYGWFIEWIESERGKLAKKQTVGPIMGMAQRIVDFRNQVTFEYLTLSLEQTKKGAEEQVTFFSHLDALKQTIPKMLEIYGNLRNDIIRIFEKTDPQVNNLPQIPNVGGSPYSYLQQLNVSLGQLFGYVLGKWFETAS